MYVEEICSIKVIYFTHQTNNHQGTKKSDATHGYSLDKKHDSHNICQHLSITVTWQE